MSVVPLSLPGSSRPRVGVPLRTTVALWWLAVKRCGGPLLLLAVVGCVGWLVWNGQLDGVVLWVLNVQQIAFSVAVVGPLVAAFACWAAGQSRRRGLSHLLDSTALPAPWVVMAGTAGVIFWGLAGFLGSAGVVLLWTATAATWGGPDPRPIVVAAGAIVVCGLLGAFAGRLSANRLLPPLMAIGGVAFIVAPMGLSELQPVEMFSPLAVINTLTSEWFFDVDDEVVGPHLRWLAALGFTLAVAVVLWPARGWLSRGLLLVGGVATLLTAIPLVGWPAPVFYGFDEEPLPYEPACVAGTVTVCVHPAYESLLDESATMIESFIQPIAGLEGVPSRFEQDIGPVLGDSGEGWFYLYDAGALGDHIPQMLATELMASPLAEAPQGDGAAQYVVAEWLIQRVHVQRPGVSPLSMFDMHPAAAPVIRCDETGCVPEEPKNPLLRQEFDAAVARFAALDPAARRAWLEANWTDLRAGRLDMEDLP